MSLSIKWEPNARPYAGGDVAKAGKWEVGSVHEDRLRPVGTRLMYEAGCRLPGIKARLGRFPTEEEARARVERAVTFWFKHTTLEVD